MTIYRISPLNLTETVAAAAEPISLVDMKAHLSVDTSDDDKLITSQIKAARSYVERVTGRALVRRTYRADVPGFYEQFIFPFPPLASITSIKYYDTNSPSVLTTLRDTSVSPVVTSTVYDEYLSAQCIKRGYGETFEQTFPRPDSVQITFVAGYAPDSASPVDHAANVDEALIQAIKLIVGDMYMLREASVIGTVVAKNPALQMFLNSYRDFV